jgi:uncharacterized membrane protein YeiH
MNSALLPNIFFNFGITLETITGALKASERSMDLIGMPMVARVPINHVYI